MPLLLTLSVGAALAAASGPASAQDAGPRMKRLGAVRIVQPPRIDGALDDPAWQGIPERDDFLQSYPGRGTPPNQRTTLRVASDEENLYFGVVCSDPQVASIDRWLSRRDRYANTDEIEINLDSYSDRRTALRFILSAAGVQRDGAIYNDGEYDREWDGVWEGRTQLAAGGWTAEIRIPFSQLPLRAGHSGEFGLQVRRFRRTSNEVDEWVYIAPWEQGEVSRYGRLEGLAGIRPGSRWELLPFAVAQRRAPAPGESFLGRTGLTGDAGLDLRYRPVPNFTLNATFNPDFGQVELDQVVLNLTTFETFFPEKRPFFLEGSGFFTTPFTLFHSRRIGEAPAFPALGTGDELLHLPQESTILGAAKWTGKTAGGLTVGALQAITEAERAVVRRSGGGIEEETVAPQASHSVIRLKQDFLRNSSAGLIATLQDRNDGCEAIAAGLDWNLRLRDNEYAVSGQLLRTRINDPGLSDPTRCGHFAAGEDPGDGEGVGGLVSVAREGGLHWRWSLDHTWLSPDAEFNDLGFMPRPDQRSSSALLEYREDRPGEQVQEYSISLFGAASHNQAGADFSRSADLSFDLELRNFWSFSGALQHEFEIFDDRETRGGPLFRVPPLDSIILSGASDPRRSWTGSFFASLGEEFDGSFWSAGPGAAWRVGRRLELGASVSYSRSTGSLRWVETIESPPGVSHYIFGDLDRRDLSLNLEGTLAITPDFSVQARAQLFAAGVDYSSFVELVEPERLELTPAAAGFSSRPDFRTAAINAQIVTRWQYRPGSYLTFVLTRQQDDDSLEEDLSAGETLPGLARTARRISGVDGETVALIKLSYWWSP